MKPKNFPARKLRRQIDAKRDRSQPYTKDEKLALNKAVQTRTKINRSSR